MEFETDAPSTPEEQPPTCPDDCPHCWELLAAIMESPADGRETRLERVCEKDPAHTPRLRRLYRSEAEFESLAAHGSDALPPLEGDFELLHAVGRGGMGVVYRARQRSVGRDVALKFLHPELQRSELARRRLQAEIEAAGRLRHPGIVQVHGLHEARGFPFIAMEFVHGRSLREALNEFHHRDPRTLDVDERARLVGRDPVPARSHADGVLDLMIEVAGALAHAHAAGIAHRDLKPSNLMMRDDGSIVLVDFGLAADEGRSALTPSGQALGSPAYMAPERLLGGGEPRRSDVWSFGVILYELLCLRHPFATEEEEAPSTLRAAAGRFVPPRRIDPTLAPDLEAVCLAALEADVALRYPDAPSLLSDLLAVREGRAISRRASSVPERLRRWRRRHPARATALFSLALVLVIAPLVFGWQQWQHGLALKDALDRVETQRNEARDQASFARETYALLQRILRESVPRTSAPIDLPRFLDNVGARVRESLDRRAGAKAELFALLGLIRTHFEEYPAADALFREGLKIAEKELPPSHPGQLDCLIGLATTAYERGDFEEALANLDRCGTMNQERLIRALDLSASLAPALEDPELLARSRRKLEALFEEGIPDPQDRVLAGTALARILAFSGRADDAIELLQDSLRILREDDRIALDFDRPVRLQLALLALQLHRLPLAEEQLNAILTPDPRRAPLAPISKRETQTQLAVLRMFQGRHDEALQILDRLGPPPEVASKIDEVPLVRIDILLRQGKADAALKLIDAQAPHGKKGNRLVLTRLIETRGRALLRLGRIEEASAEFDAAIHRCSESGMDHGSVLLRALLGRSRVQRLRGDLKGCFATGREFEAIVASRSGVDEVLLASARMERAQVALKAGRIADGERVLRLLEGEYRERDDAIGLTLLAGIQENIAALENARRNDDAARRYYIEASESYEDAGHPAAAVNPLLALSHLELRNRKREAAKRALDDALELASTCDEKRTDLQVDVALAWARALKRTHPGAAARRVENALQKLARARPADRTRRHEATIVLALVRLEQKRAPQALALVEEVLVEQRKILAPEDDVLLFNEAIRGWVLVNGGRHEEGRAAIVKARDALARAVGSNHSLTQRCEGMLRNLPTPVQR